MKKYITFLLGLLLICTVATAQNNRNEGVATFLNASSVAADTITNTGTGYVSVALAGYLKSVSIQADYTRVSGTAAGTLKLQASNDGVTYSDVANYTYSIAGVTGTQGTIWKLDNYAFKYIRVYDTGSGTNKGYIKAKAWWYR